MARNNYFEYENSVRSSSSAHGDYTELDGYTPTEESMKKEQDVRVKVPYEQALDGITIEETEREQATQTAQQLGDFALALSRLSSELTAYHQSTEKTFENPFNHEPPYQLTGAQFVYWALEMFGVDLELDQITIQGIKLNRKYLKRVSAVGSYTELSDLRYGDIILLGANDNQIGIYVGNNEFVSFLGTGKHNFEKGVTKKKLDKGIWYKQYKGHVLRIKEKGAE